MKFKTYLEENNISFAIAAGELDASSEGVRLWAEGMRVPRPDQMKRIYEWSNGMVQPNDYYDLPEIGDTRANGHDPVLMNTVAAA